MDFIKFPIDSAYTMDMDACIADKETLAVIRSVFRDLKEHGYVNIGDFFNSISDSDLIVLLDMAEAIGPTKDEFTVEDQEVALRNLMMLSMALTVGEGEMLVEDTIYKSINSISTYIVLESLYRKGLVDVYRDKWSLTQSNMDTIASLRK